MNQNIVGSTQDLTGHAEGKLDADSRLEGAADGKQDTGGGDILGDGSQFAVIGGEDDGQRKWKADRATNFLPRAGRIVLGGG
jgi:hypothetical protein